MDDRAAAIASLLESGPFGLQELIAHFHGPGHPKKSPEYRDIDWALQRLQARGLVYYAGLRWHYGSKPELDTFVSVTSSGQVVPLSPSKTARRLAAMARRKSRAEALERFYSENPLNEHAANNYTPVPESGCWLWLGAWDANGYGRTGLRSSPGLAHRRFYELHIGPIPEGMIACHKCDTPACVNPAHLFIGTVQDNTDDMIRKGRGSWQKAALQHRGDSRGGEE